jgi:hypothetical protein
MKNLAAPRCHDQIPPVSFFFADPLCTPSPSEDPPSSLSCARGHSPDSTRIIDFYSVSRSLPLGSRERTLPRGAGTDSLCGFLSVVGGTSLPNAKSRYGCKIHLRLQARRLSSGTDPILYPPVPIKHLTCLHAIPGLTSPDGSQYRQPWRYCQQENRRTLNLRCGFGALRVDGRSGEALRAMRGWGLPNRGPFSHRSGGVSRSA